MSDNISVAAVYFILLGIVALLRLNEPSGDEGWKPISLSLDLPNKWCRIVARSCMTAGIILITVHSFMHDCSWYYSIAAGVLGSYGVMMCMSFIVKIFCEIIILLLKLIMKISTK